MSFLSKLNELFGKKPVAAEKPVELKKRTMKLVSKKEMVDLGVTYVLLKFSDGRELVTRVYGKFTQNGEVGKDEGYDGRMSLLKVQEPYVSGSGLITSLNEAESFISRVGKGRRTDLEFLPPDNTFVDCPRVPTKSEVGKVITATILRTESNLEEVTKYSVEKI